MFRKKSGESRVKEPKSTDYEGEKIPLYLNLRDSREGATNGLG